MDLTENEAKTRRTTIKAATTRLKTYIESAQAQRATEFDLVERRKKLATLFVQYDEVQARIECLNSDANEAITATHAEDRSRFEEAYFQLMSIYDQRINSIEQTRVASQTSIDTQTAHQNNSESAHIRLPKIQLPIFSGSYEEWYTFHDSFEKLIHSNANLSSIQKFHYLRSSLKDKAAEVVRSFDITTDNYTEAWQLLNERFDNKRRMVQTHIKAIFEIPPINKENCTALRSLIDNVLKHFRALKALQRPVDTWDDIMIHLVLTKLDSVTVKEWETSRADSTIPTFKQLTDFLSKRCQALEIISGKSSGRTSSDVHNSQKAKNPSAHVTTSNLSCIHCKSKHFIFQCESFRKLPGEKRFEIAKNAHFCINCLRSGGHQAKNCTASTCRKCGKPHNTLLHFETSKDEGVKTGMPSNTSNSSCSVTGASSTNTASPIVTQCTQINDASKVFLSTAIVSVYDRKGELHGCRVLLDSGSQLNFITEDFANRLHLNSRELHMSISGVAKGTIETKGIVDVSFRSRTNAYVDSIECIVLPKITQKLPQEFCSISEFTIPSNIVLADPNFNIPSEIDILIGAQLFWKLICVGQIRACKAHPTLQKTKVGWVISGKTDGSSDKKIEAVCHLSAINRLNEAIVKFWEVEHDTSSNKMSHYNPNEQICESHFNQNVRRDTEGRFIVKLPTIDEKLQQLGDSREIAKRRFLNLEKRLSTQPLVYSQCDGGGREGAAGSGRIPRIPV
ncbi:PREDICTED: uncharacterized protein LOC105568157 [Vollenhovia emeryi]|uniref:uncharacterized protein LOC105568157 n=1 Tax=Vollenhovia emeryi TaxID=411798 RepID=UPI0005F4D4EE|nr:PREDICTED: uncharacterized protein LOC105568157 [Vollenhovia emeryi]